MISITQEPPRTTLMRPVTTTGIGIHTGMLASVRLQPASGPTGIRFHRVDREAFVSVSPDAIRGSDRATVLSDNSVIIRTPEHLLAALYASGITDLDIHIDNTEVPIVDGSALPWIQLLQAAGKTAIPGRCKPPVVIQKAIRLCEGACETTQLLAIPDKDFKITYILNHEPHWVGIQVVHGKLETDWFINTIAPARTFGFASDLAALQAQGLASGASVDNCLGITDTGYTRPLRVEKELACHKILDIIGDLAILGRAIQGHIIGIHSGHALNLRLVAELASL